MQSESTAYAIPASNGVVGLQVGSGGLVTITGFSLAETAGTATRVELRDGGVASGTIIAVCTINNSSSSPLLPDVKVNAGLYVKLTGGGTVVGSIFFR